LACQCKESPDMYITKRLLLGLALAGLIAYLTMENVVVQPAYAAEKVSLFKVITTREEIVIGIPEGELATMGGNAGGIAKVLVQKGTLSVWQYAVRKAVRSRADASAQGRADRQRLAARRAVCDPAQVAANRRQPEIGALRCRNRDTV